MADAPPRLFKPTVLLAVALMAIIVMMILPMPSFVLDLGLAASFGLAILIFTVTLFIERPLDFSAFPTILLASLMLRLSLNVSSTKLIIGQGHTGTGAARLLPVVSPLVKCPSPEVLRKQARNRKQGEKNHRLG